MWVFFIIYFISRFVFSNTVVSKTSTAGYCVVFNWQRRDSIDMEKSPIKSKHVTIDTVETVDTNVADDPHG